MSDGIVYLGKGDELRNGMKSAIESGKTAEKVKFDQFSFNENSELLPLFPKVVELTPKCIVIDIKVFDKELIDFLFLLQSHDKTREAKSFAFFLNKENIEVFKDIFSFGIEFGVLLGEDLEKIIEMILFIAFDPKLVFSQYAKITNLKIPTYGYSLTKLSHMEKYKIYMESNLDLNIGEKIEIACTGEEQNDFQNFQVQKKNTFLPRSYFKFTYDLDILLRGDPRNEDYENERGLDKEEFDKLFTDLKKYSFSRNNKILIVDNRLEIATEIAAYLNVKDYFIKTRAWLDPEENLIKNFRPELIFFQWEVIEDDNLDEEIKTNEAEALSYLCNEIKVQSDYNPYLVVFNNKSRSRAYQKAYQYKKLMVFPESFSGSFVPPLLDSFNKANPVSNENDTLYFKPPSSKSIMTTRTPIFITGLSENLITFTCKHTIPVFTSFKVNIPNELYFTVIPPTQELPDKKPLNHYMGIVSRADEEDLMEIRRLVNFIIGLELKEGEEFEFKSVSELQEELIQQKYDEILKERERVKQELEKKKKDEEEEKEFL